MGHALFLVGSGIDTLQEEDKHKGEVLHNEDDMPDEEDEEREEPKLSKKERKSRNKLSVAELKVCPTSCHRDQKKQLTQPSLGPCEKARMCRMDRHLGPRPPPLGTPQILPQLCSCSITLVPEAGISLFQTWCRKTPIRASQVHQRHWYYGDARFCSGARRSTVSEIKNAGKGSAQDGKT